MQKIQAIFSWIGVVLAVVVFSTLTLIMGIFDWSGALSHRMVQLWARVVLFCVRVHLEVHGTQNLEKGRFYVIASNHEGQADIPVLVRALPLQFKFASKTAVFRIPVMGWAMYAARYVPIDRGGGPEKARQAIDRMSAKLKQGFSVLMFPEGTRTRDGKVGTFKSGTFRLALQNTVDILPVGLYGSRLGMPADEWVIRGGRIIVNIGQPIRIANYENSEDGMRALRDHCREVIVHLQRDAQQLFFNEKQLTAVATAKPVGA